MVQGWLVLLALTLIAGLVMVTRAGRPAIGRVTPGAAASSPQAPATSPSAPDALPAADGSTGTVALPALPIPPEAPGTDATIVAARPFRWGAAPAIDRARAMECLTAAIYYEAGGESIDGQRAVAQVVLNRVRHPAFPSSVCGVVYQGVERRHCQFSFVCDGALSRAPATAGWARAARIAAAALSGGVFAPVGLATHYHTFAVTPVWNRAMVMTDMVGAHLFHRWKGYWGTTAAMGRAYGGREVIPDASPIAPATTPSEVAGVAIPVPPPPQPPSTPKPSSAAPAPAPTAVSPGNGAIISDRLARSGEILDKWKDSGRPLDRPAGPPPTSSATAPR